MEGLLVGLFKSVCGGGMKVVVLRLKGKSLTEGTTCYVRGLMANSLL